MFSVPEIVAGGNAGLAATYCAQQLKKPIQVIVPESTPDNVVKKLEKNGADVLVFGKVVSITIHYRWNAYDSCIVCNEFSIYTLFS